MTTLNFNLNNPIINQNTKKKYKKIFIDIKIVKKLINIKSNRIIINYVFSSIHH